jgi:hypothetical protein
VKQVLQSVRNRGGSVLSRSVLTAIAVVLVLTLGACIQPLSNSNGGSDSDGSGLASLSISIQTVGTQTVLPEQDMQVEDYTLMGSGPDGESFEVQSTDTTEEITNLEAGDWSIEAHGLNASGFLVTQGAVDTTLEPDTMNSTQVATDPVDGSGSLTITAEWNDSHTVSPTVEATIIDAYGNENAVSVPITSAGQASTTLSSVPAGYHRLSVRLLDQGTVVMGAGESVRIAADGTTTAVLSLADLNKVGEPISVTTDQFVIAWDPPSDSSSIDSYNVYYRERGTYDWTLLTNVDATSTPELTITESLLPYGTYEMAVTSVASSTESEKHTSMDDNASPSTGWYVEWIGP